ncbi:MAG TPA: hypothetical protein VFT22_31985 [Kofleriaceae bacterium]|nr:hypothetical protein [Kofleriaceae bacterium]
MKPVLFIAFLALGPALADQLTRVAPGYFRVAAGPVAMLSRPLSSNPVAPLARAPTQAERDWLCGGRS